MGVGDLRTPESPTAAQHRAADTPGGPSSSAPTLGAPPIPYAPRGHRPPSDWPFLVGMGTIATLYVLLILAMLVADAAYTSPGDLLAALNKREIRFAIWLSLISCSITAILSVWVAVPTGYLLSRARNRPVESGSERAGRLRRGGWNLVDAVLDIPIVLPPLVVGLSLLILFQTPPGKWIESVFEHRMGVVLTWGVLPALAAALAYALVRYLGGRGEAGTATAWLWAAGAAAAVVALLAMTGLGPRWAVRLQARFGTPITFAIPSVILAQFSVAAAFSVRTMRATFDQINPRSEQVALTLGCSRGQAFFMVVLPEARRGILTAATLAWARSLGEFGPILVFSGATRLRTEVLPTTVWLELSIGHIDAAVAVSLLMVACAVLVLLIVRAGGPREPFETGI